MTDLNDLAGVRQFARSYVRGITHHRQVHTEHLAEAIRGFGGLSSFPTLRELQAFCVRFGISLKSLPRVAEGMDGLNLWVASAGPEIYLRDDLKQMRAETTICHEIREVIENAFKLENAGYEGLDTSDNKVMNPESDHFASCLLMQADASKKHLTALGFDLLRFSRETGRSLPSVVLRLQNLYSVSSGEKKPAAGIWLFEAPWPLVQAGTATPSTMAAKYSAQLCGFSMRKGGPPEALVARGSFPAKNSKLMDFAIGALAVQKRAAMMADLSGFDLFLEHNYHVVAEPILTRHGPWRLLAVAVRNDGLPLFNPWLQRLSIATKFGDYQSVAQSASA